MLRNFFIVAVRNFLRQRTQSILNVSGLALGIACSIYVYLYVYDELTYDRQHPHPENTYRLIWKYIAPDGQEEMNTWSVPGWANYMKESLKGVRSYTTLNTYGWPHSFYYTPENGDQRIVLTENVVYAPDNYTDFFFLDLVAGHKNSLLEQPTDMLISESAAHTLFGDGPALNKEIEFSHPFYLDNAKTTLVVKGVFRDMPYNMQFGRTTKFILNRALRKAQFEKTFPQVSFENALTTMVWPAHAAFVYFQAEPDADLDLLKEQLTTELNKLVAEKFTEKFTVDPEFLKITETHFSPIPFLVHPELTGNKQYVYIFLTIGIFILLISCINYVNLTTARSVRRAKEVGMRKALGSSRRQLIFQFLQEAFFITSLAVVAALLIAIVLLPYFSDFANKDFAVSDIFSIPSVLMILSLWIFVSVVAGIYPAFYVSSQQPAKTLKGATTTGKPANVLRQTLIGFQFAVALILVAFTFVVIRQMRDMINNDLNKSGDQILTIRYGNIAPINKLEVFRNELARIPDLSISTFGNHLPRREGYAPLSYEVTIPDLSAAKYTWDMMCIGADFHKVFDLELLAGSFFDRSTAIDSMEILVNEEVSRQLHMDVHALLGMRISVNDDQSNRIYNFRIRGVYKDFKYKSVHNKIEPLILSVQKERSNSIAYYIKLPADRISENIATVEKIWRDVMPPGVGITYNFLSDEFNRLYFEENALYDLSRVFTILGIITTSIGLFGMSIFLAERRSKEMAIRKTMGAGSSHVLRKMVMPFVKLLMIASLIGIPIAYYFSTRWLDNFVYKVEWSWLTTSISILLILVITLFTISFQSLRLANQNPVKSLKQE